MILHFKQMIKFGKTGGDSGGGSGISPTQNTQDRLVSIIDIYPNLTIDSLFFLRNNYDDAFIDSTLDSLEYYADQYPELRTFIKRMYPESRARVYASMSTQGHLSLNTRLLNDSNRESEYNNDVAHGFHPQGTTWTSIVDHELAHALDAKMSHIKSGDFTVLGTSFTAAPNKGNTNWWVSNEIVKASASYVKSHWKDFGYTSKPTTAQLKESISGYATKDTAETFAEALADYRANGSNASVLSQTIYTALQEFRKQL